MFLVVMLAHQPLAEAAVAIRLPYIRLGLLQQAGMLFKPLLSPGVIRKGTFDLLPEPRRMIHLAEVEYLMDANIRLDKGWGLNQPPVERDGAAPGT